MRSRMELFRGVGRREVENVHIDKFCRKLNVSMGWSFTAKWTCNFLCKIEFYFKYLIFSSY